MAPETWLLLLLVIIFCLGTLWHWSQDKKLRHERQHYTRDRFVDDGEREHLDRDVCLVIWNYFAMWLGRTQYPIYLSDSIGRGLRMADDDLDEAVLEIIEGSSRILPPGRDTEDQKPSTPLETIRDLALYVSQLPKRGRTGHS